MLCGNMCKACLPAETMLCAWEMLGMHSLAEAWCMRIGRAVSPASGVKESELNAWQAIFLRLAHTTDPDGTLEFDNCLRVISCLHLSWLIWFCPPLMFCSSFVWFWDPLPRLPFFYFVINCLILSSVSSSLALSLSHHVLSSRLVLFFSLWLSKSNLFTLSWDYAGRKLLFFQSEMEVSSSTLHSLWHESTFIWDSLKWIVMSLKFLSLVRCFSPTENSLIRASPTYLPASSVVDISGTPLSHTLSFLPPLSIAGIYIPPLDS